MTSNDKTFVKITNKDIYDEMMKFHQINAEQHTAIIKRLDVTNGKVKLARWIASTALVVSLMILGYLIQHISQTGHP